MTKMEASILLVEDDDIDAEAIERAFVKARIANPVLRACDGIEALEMLRGEREPYITRPFIILLDLKMPRMGGLQFLDALRADPELKNSVVFVLTTSNADRDKAEAYLKQTAGYIVKSRAGDEFIDLIGLLDHYWRVVELPESEGD